MPPKGSSKKRDAEEAPAANGGSDDKKAPAAATGELRRSTRGGGHPAPEPKAAAAPSAAKPRATKKAKTAEATEEAGEKPADANGNGKEEEATAPAGPTEPTKDGVAEGIPTEEKGVTVPEENKEIAKAAEAEAATGGDKDASKAAKRLEVGESLPEGLILKNENDEDVSIADIVKEKGAVFFVYPKVRVHESARGQHLDKLSSPHETSSDAHNYWTERIYTTQCTGQHPWLHYPGLRLQGPVR